MFSNLFYFLRLLFAASPALVIGELAWGVLTVLPGQLVSVLGVKYVIYTFVAGFVSGLLALGLTRLGLGHQADKIMIGDIMLLIPGLLLVNAIKEMFNRDIVTGLYRLIEAVLVALAIAGGYALAFLVMGGATV